MLNQFKKEIPLAPYTTFQIGGRAAYFCSVTNVDELRDAALWAKEIEEPITILGGGSNILVSDRGVPGLVIKNNISGITYETDGDAVYVTVGAGEQFDAFIDELVRKKIWGLENLSGIPGSVGATPIQNVGAYGVEVSEHITSVLAYDVRTNVLVTFSGRECGFRYRHSVFKREEYKRYIIVSVTFTLSKNKEPILTYRDLTDKFGTRRRPSIRDIRNAVLDIRAKKFPDWKKVGTAGSFFKNPIVPVSDYETLLDHYPGMPGYRLTEEKVKIPLGWILEHVLTMKGYRYGRVGTYTGQALVLINHGGASAHEVVQFANFVTKMVKNAVNIDIEWEATYMGRPWGNR